MKRGERGQNRGFSFYHFSSKNNRGISDIIVTVILAGLVLAVIAVVWVVIRNLLSQATGGINLGSITIRLEIQNAYKSGSDVFVKVNRLTGKGEVLGAVFITYNDTDSETTSKDFSLNELETKTINFPLSKLDIATAIKVSVAPVFASASNEKTTGDVQSTFIFGAGSTQQQGGQQGTGDCTPACSGNTPICLDTVCVQCIEISDCPAGTEWESCTSNHCIPTSCEDTRTDAQVCGTRECGTAPDECFVQRTCLPGCSAGQKCTSGSCVLIQDINHGIVQEIWPAGSNIYFSSSDMNTGIDYTGKFASFPGSLEINCRLIAKFISYIDAPAYGKSIAGFNFETEIAVGNNYKIWDSQEDCQYSVGQL